MHVMWSKNAISFLIKPARPLCSLRIRRLLCPKPPCTFIFSRSTNRDLNRRCLWMKLRPKEGICFSAPDVDRDGTWIQTCSKWCTGQLHTKHRNPQLLMCPCEVNSHMSKGDIFNCWQERAINRWAHSTHAETSAWQHSNPESRIFQTRLTFLIFLSEC